MQVRTKIIWKQYRCGLSEEYCELLGQQRSPTKKKSGTDKNKILLKKKYERNNVFSYKGRDINNIVSTGKIRGSRASGMLREMIVDNLTRWCEMRLQK